MSKNLKRAPYGEKTKARVREMREAGYSVVQITEATGVPGSTIARWAAEGGWRVSDLVEEDFWDSSREASASHGAGSRLRSDVASEPEGRLHGLEGVSWDAEGHSFLRRQESGCSAVDRDPRLRGDERMSGGDEEQGALEQDSVLFARAGSSPGSSPGFGRRSAENRSAGSIFSPPHPAQSLVMSTQQPDRAGRSRGEPEAIRKGEQTEENHKTRQERLEDALEKAAKAAEDVITRGNFTAAGKAVQMADTLSKALERVRASAAKEQPDGVFLSRAEIDAARADLMRRMDRIAKKFRPDEGGGL